MKKRHGRLQTPYFQVKLMHESHPFNTGNHRLLLYLQMACLHSENLEIERFVSSYQEHEYMSQNSIF